MIYVNDASDPQNAPVTPSKITGFTKNGPTLRCISDHTNDKITISLPGVYSVAGQMSFSGSGAATFAVHVYKNTSNTSIGFHRKMGATGDVGSASMVGLVDCAEGDDLSIWGAADAGSKTATLIDAQLTAHLLA